jgi:hypothetical protein
MSPVLVTREDAERIGKERVSELIVSKDFEGALNEALTSSNLEVVLHFCRSADIGEVFEAEPPIGHHILLSFIQQLSVNVENEISLKVQIQSKYPHSNE